MNLLLEAKVCITCVQPRPLPWFVGDGHAFVLLDECSFCRDSLSYHEQKISYNKCRAKRIVLHNNWRARQLGLPADLTIEQWRQDGARQELDRLQKRQGKEDWLT